MWVFDNGQGANRLDLVGIDGITKGASVATPTVYPWGRDGTGRVVVEDNNTGASYLTGQDGTKLITTGTVLAGDSDLARAGVRDIPHLQPHRDRPQHWNPKITRRGTSRQL